MAAKTVLVTGATGLLGRQVVRAFQAADWTVKGTGFSRADGVTVHKVDLADAAQVEKALDETKSVADVRPVRRVRRCGANKPLPLGRPLWCTVR